jgi:hypothetical protein
MDGGRFDDLLRTASESRRSILGALVAGGVSSMASRLALVDAASAKKGKGKGSGKGKGKGKKKKKKNENDLPCNSLTCKGCCDANGECDEQGNTPDSCGTGGGPCNFCLLGEGICKNHACCAPLGGHCHIHQCCDFPEAASCVNATCCSGWYQPCNFQNSLCCPDGKCVPPQLNLPTPFCCPDFLTSGDTCCEPEHLACGEKCCEPGEECKDAATSTCGPGCAINGNPCHDDHDCCEDEDICDSGICKRNRGESCNQAIICRDRYPHCVAGACRRCPLHEISTGTDELCCPAIRSCPAANDGRGSCCQHDHCCRPPEEGELECPELEFPGLLSCA